MNYMAGWFIFLIPFFVLVRKKKGGHLIFKIQYYKDMLNAC